MPRKVLVTSTRCLVSLSLSFLLAIPDVARAAPQAPAPTPTKLNIVIVEGEGAINNIRQRTAREPIVQVEDENHRPVAGAAVLFLLPDSGPSGTFANGARSLTVSTDGKGQAVAKGLRLNDAQGEFQIQVEASYQGLSATAAITQTNAVLAFAGGGVSGKLLGILAAVGGAAAVGAVLATRGGGGGGPSSPPANPTTINAGAPSVGRP